MSDEIYAPGLDGIVVGETSISDVDGENGQLIYRDQSIESLVNRPFFEVAYLVLFGREPSADQTQALTEFMTGHNCLSDSEQLSLRGLPRHLHPMAMLQGLVPLLDTSGVQEDLAQTADAIGIDPALSQSALAGLLVAAKIPALVAAWHRLKHGESLVAAAEGTDFHHRFLSMLHGHPPTAGQAKTLDATQILQMEHSFNCGTFTGRVCASSQASIQASISASIGALSGVLHGGADQAALEMAESLGSPQQASAYVAEALANKDKIMGMGHREYKVLDPRAKLLKPMAQTLCTEPEAKRLLDTLMAVESACQAEFKKKGKDIHANVEFYKGAVFHALGIPAEFFTALFAMSRSFGYIAHYLEFSQNSRLIRPKARYLGSTEV